MRYDFKSGFGESLNKFVEQKNAIGIAFSSNIWVLSGFDKMCTLRYPSANVLTREICDEWALKKPTECGNTFRNRISPIREFAKYLIRNGEEAYVIPTDLAKKSPRHLPYIYSKDEIKTIWNEYDSFNPVPYLPARHIVLPAVMRVIYCCGLRPVEACRLKTQDVDLSIGKLHIRESKGHKDRIVMMADDVAEYLSEYDKKLRKILPRRDWFFTNAYGECCTVKWLDHIFLRVYRKLGICGINGTAPRIYDFRHSFATHRLYEWMRNGDDLNAMLPYLSAYMGHAELSDTYYYIHLVPEQFAAMSGVNLTHFEGLLPEVDYDN